MRSPQAISSDHTAPPIIGYESAFAQRRFHARVRLAMWCGLAPLMPLIITLLGCLLSHDRRWLFAAIASLILSHGVVGFGLFLLCMEYAIQRDRLMPRFRFLHESRHALVALLVNWPIFVAIIFIAWRWT